MPSDGSSCIPRRRVINTATAMAADLLWEVVLYEGEHVEIYPVGHSTDPETLSMADDALLQDLVLPPEREETHERERYYELADDLYDRWKDSRLAA